MYDLSSMACAQFPSKPSTAINEFLRKAKEQRFIQEPLLLVLGNESCDLDSAISAITLAYFYAKSSNSSFLLSGLRIRPDRIVPILNIPRKLLPIRTEVTFFLRQHGIDLENVLCRDEIPESTFERAHFILVDHHVSEYAARAVQVIDHRHIDSSNTAVLPANCSKRIELVGSCCTLIADMILSEQFHRAQTFSDELLNLLHPVILLDTSNFSENLDRTTTLDREVCARIEQRQLLHRRRTVYAELAEARQNVSALDVAQLLQKDTKIVQRAGGNVSVALATMPIALRKFVQMPSAAKDLIRIASSEFKCDVIVLTCVTSVVNDDDVVHMNRELSVIRTADTERAKRLHTEIIHRLKDPQSNFQLRERNEPELDILGGSFFTQGNLKACRKQMLPIVEKIVYELKI